MGGAAAALALLPAPASDWEGRHRIAPPASRALTLAGLAQDAAALDAALHDQAQAVPGADDRLAAAYLTGALGWQAGMLLGGLWLAGFHAAGIGPADLAVDTRFVLWDRAGAEVRSPVLDLTLDPAGLAAGPDDIGLLARLMVDLFEPLVPAITRRSGLGPPAQWRLVGDGLANALLDQGRALGCRERAIALGRAAVADRGTRLYSRQTEFVHVTFPAGSAPDCARASDWFVLRGGCCRYYTSAGGEYCSTCVLRDRDSQIARLQDYLGTTLAA